MRGAQLVGTNTAVFFPLDTTVTMMQLRFFFFTSNQMKAPFIEVDSFFFFEKAFHLWENTEEFAMIHRGFSFME